MRRFGFEEKEAHVSYYLERARSLLEEVYTQGAEDAVGRASAAFSFSMHVDPHFDALDDLLARRVLARDYPEGWGHRAETGEDTSER